MRKLVYVPMSHSSSALNKKLQIRDLPGINLLQVGLTGGFVTVKLGS